jgi:hypothetical protein
MTVAFVSGALCLGFLVASLFFLRFWRETRDRLFLFFTMSFVVLALQRITLMMTSAVPALELPSYGLRLLAFLLMLAAIVDKNLRPRR